MRTRSRARRDPPHAAAELDAIWRIVTGDWARPLDRLPPKVGRGEHPRPSEKTRSEILAALLRTVHSGTAPKNAPHSEVLARERTQPSTLAAPMRIEIEALLKYKLRDADKRVLDWVVDTLSRHEPTLIAAARWKELLNSGLVEAGATGLGPHADKIHRDAYRLADEGADPEDGATRDAAVRQLHDHIECNLAIVAKRYLAQPGNRSALEQAIDRHWSDGGRRLEGDEFRSPEARKRANVEWLGLRAAVDLFLTSLVAEPNPGRGKKGRRRFVPGDGTAPAWDELQARSPAIAKMLDRANELGFTTHNRPCPPEIDARGVGRRVLDKTLMNRIVELVKKEPINGRAFTPIEAADHLHADAERSSYPFWLRERRSWSALAVALVMSETLRSLPEDVAEQTLRSEGGHSAAVLSVLGYLRRAHDPSTEDSGSSSRNESANDEPVNGDVGDDDVDVRTLRFRENIQEFDALYLRRVLTALHGVEGASLALDVPELWTIVSGRARSVYRELATETPIAVRLAAVGDTGVLPPPTDRVMALREQFGQVMAVFDTILETDQDLTVDIANLREAIIEIGTLGNLPISDTGDARDPSRQRDAGRSGLRIVIDSVRRGWAGHAQLTFPNDPDRPTFNDLIDMLRASIEPTGENGTGS